MNEGAIASLTAREKRSIPSEVIRPLIQKYVNEYQRRIGAEPGKKDNARSLVMGECKTRVEGLNRDKFYFANAVEVLAEEAGLTTDCLYRHLTGRRQWMEFAIADRLLCAMGLPDLWYLEPLASYYETVSIL